MNDFGLKYFKGYFIVIFLAFEYQYAHNVVLTSIRANFMDVV